MDVHEVIGGAGSLLLSVANRLCARIEVALVTVFIVVFTVRPPECQWLDKHKHGPPTLLSLFPDANKAKSPLHKCLEPVTCTVIQHVLEDPGLPPFAAGIQI